MPALREHKEDIEDLCYNFLKEFSTTRKSPFTLAKNTLNCLHSYDYPGNVRELRNLMERASVLCHGPEITPSDLPTDLCQKPQDREMGFNLAENMFIAEREFLIRALRHCKSNRTETAALLGISRKNLWEKLKSHDIQ